MNTKLKGRTALVTGGGTGIGRGIAIGMAREGASIVVNYRRSENEARATVQQIEEIGGKAVAIKADVTRWDDVTALFKSARSHFGQVDILVNNAGGTIKKQELCDMSEDIWDQTLALNLKSVFLCCKAAIPQFPDGSGRIINIASISGYSGGGQRGVAYGTAKGAVITMTRGLAHELASRRITVNGIAPGIVATRQHEQFTSPQDYQSLIKRIPLGRDGKSDDLVGVAILLASDAGSYITGETIQVNGGMLMN